MKRKMTNTNTYDYDLPKEFIASKPVYPASKAKLLVYDRSNQQVAHTTFEHIIDFIPQNTSIILNDTKVIKARIFGQKSTGGKVELLLNKSFGQNQFLCYIRGKVHIDTKIYFEKDLSCKVLNLFEDGSRVVQFFQDDKIIDFVQLIEILNIIGHLPLPPYINREDTQEDNQDYQTLFAKNYGAVAAPTASLHFTKELLEMIKNSFETSTLTLHVGAGTFKPIEVDNILEHPMHSESFTIPSKTLDIIDSNKKILAVGTTVTRTIEYYYKTKLSSGEADIFLHPLNIPQRVDYLLTNFHFPKSTLIMLVASFIGVEKTLELYELAKKNNYRFYSYGDGMLII